MEVKLVGRWDLVQETGYIRITKLFPNKFVLVRESTICYARTLLEMVGMEDTWKFLDFDIVKILQLESNIRQK